MASRLVSTPGRTPRSEKDSFMMTIRFTGRVSPSEAARSAASSEGYCSARDATAWAE